MDERKNQKRKITSKKKDKTEKNKVRNSNLLTDAELSNVETEFCYNLFMLRQIEKGNSKPTQDFYERFFKKYFSYLETVAEGKETPVDFITVEGVRLGFIQSLGEVNQQTKNAYLRGYRAFGNFCEDEGFVVGFKCPIKEEPLPPKECYTQKEKDKLTVKPRIENFEEYRNYTIVCLLLATGIRTNSILNLRIKDVDLEEGTITLLKTKTGVNTILPLQKKAKLALKEYIDYWRRVGDGDIEDTDYLFCNVYGEQLTRGGLSTAIARYNRSRGVDKTSIHLFRHTYAKDWILSGGDLISLSLMLTHKELDMVKHYANLYPVDLRDKVEQYSSSAQMRERSGKTLTTRKREEELE